MTPIRTTYLRPWQPPPFSPSRSSAGIPRGTGPTEGGPPDMVGTITLVSSAPGPVAPGTAVTLTVVRTGGSAPMTYEWRGPGDVVIPGQTGPTLTISPTVSGAYRVIVDSPGAKDAPVSTDYMVVVAAPVVIGTITITASPTGPVALGTSVTLTAVRTGGSAPLTYAWMEFGIPIPNQTGPTLAITATVSGDYKVTVTSAGATDSPQSATYGLVVQAAGAPWTPADLPGLETWFDAEEGITLNGTNVVQWVSKGRTVVTLSQPEAAQQPSLAIEGGKKYIAPLREVDALRTLLASEFTFRTVLTVADLRTSAAGNKYPCFSAIRLTTNRDTFLAIGMATPGGYNVFALVANAVASINGTPVANLGALGDYQAGVDVGAGMCFIGGTASADVIVPVAPAEFTVAGDIAFGGYNQSGLINGRIAQLIFLSVAISASDQEKFDGWAAHTYGATVKLPANHPYKAAPPTK